MKKPLFCVSRLDLGLPTLDVRVSRLDLEATTWEYDPAGDLITQTMSTGESIDYNYNYNQLMNVNYSDKYWNNVWYEYGTNGNEKGRLVKQQDATGVQEFKYGNMGELIYNRHTYVVPNSSEPFSLLTEWTYDSWNRVKQITYPDNEIVTYNYNLGGLLYSVEGVKQGNGIKYIESINYDEYEQRTEAIYGNGTSTSYSYDPLMRRMTNLITKNPNGELLNLNYGYDNVGNILSIDNTGMNPYHQEYSYDNIYQLSSAQGNWFNNNQVNYNMNLEYSPSGRILHKKLGANSIDNNNTPIPIDYDNYYNYSYNNPYGVDIIDNQQDGKYRHFDWDAKGNMVKHESPQWDIRQFCWTEDNRLQAVKDYHTGSYYNYDATGERNLKLTGANISVTQNGQLVNAPVFDQQTLYASALVTVNDKGYTKHYFEENNRICSKIGNGDLRDINILVDPLETGYDEQREKQTEGITKTYEQCMNITPYIQNKNIYDDIIKQYEQQVTPDEPSFYYHGDHLGSASYITDENGNETQHLVYLPFGEDWVDWKYNTSQFETPFKFNGKEKDEETGYHYFGARFYWSEGSIWLSVDPMSDKYPSLSSYAYCANNPIMLIDPNGMNIDDYFTNSGKYLGSDGASTDNVRIIDQGRWNDIKTTNTDGSETVNHYVGYANSSANSEAGLTEDASLNIFDHYRNENFKENKLPLSTTNVDVNMQVSTTYNGKTNKIVNSTLEINLSKNNKQGISNHYNEIINLFSHEETHRSDQVNLGMKEFELMGKNAQELRAIDCQINHPSFNKTRSGFKEAIFDLKKKLTNNN